ncbi:hypothetical protein Ahy_A08g037740 isoform C [Arachis hypogaea]|uniref:Uncharacterized protein n=1 Tax=Arachis hypogaea TaxID=3818 RepID=A0A445BRN0_ARAHY|nr:hypothetical protein Ahy_A08g037740 isoform C [Arachis hypogaea]
MTYIVDDKATHRLLSTIKNQIIPPGKVSGIAGTGLLDLLFEILEQNMNISNTEDNKKSLKYVLISCIPRSRTSIFFPYLFLLSIK